MHKLQNSTIYRCFCMLSRNDRKKLVLGSCTQIFLSILDLIGVGLIGIIGAMAVRGIQSQNPGGRTQQVIEFFSLNTFTIQTQVTIIGISAAVVLLGRTALSMLIARKILRFLAKRSSEVAAILTSGILSKSLLFIQERSRQELIYAASIGVETVFLKVLAASVSFISDAALLILMLIVLILIDPVIALVTMILFLGVAFLLYYFMHNKAQYLGIENSRIEVEINSRMSEIFDSYREAIVHDRQGFYADKINDLRTSSFGLIAKINFLPSITKYVIELTLVLGSLVVGGFEFLTNDSVRAVATIAVFMAVSSRIAPAIMRLQQAAIQIRSNIGAAEITIRLSEELKRDIYARNVVESFNTDYVGFKPTISVDNLSFTYPNSKSSALKNVSFAVGAGETVAILGRSGAGKTTLVDCILGILPVQGNSIVKISDTNPLESFKIWPGAISDVPQEINLIKGSIKENICFGYKPELFDEADFWEAIKSADLYDFVRSTREGLDFQIAENGSNLSGGQKQRVGIARALFTKPRILILDEATSALDNETERAIAKAIKELAGKITILVIAHRLSTVRSAGSCLYIHDGEILAAGNYEYIKSVVPNFDQDI